MQKRSQEAYLGFSYFLGIGPARFATLHSTFSSIEEAYCAPVRTLSRLIGAQTAHKFAEFRTSFNPTAEIERLISKNIRIICKDDPLYPVRLNEIPDPPICLYARGNPAILNKKKTLLGVVGTRKPSSYGRQVAGDLVARLVGAGFAIVSGLADGIDTVAHEMCLDSGGVTIGVLGCGVDIVYPASNRPLYERIIRQDGLVLSEFPPSQMVAKGLFISRNRIISGLSNGILVVEGAGHSGSLITARHAAEQGRDVFAVPSQITSPLSEAPHLLIQQGAKLVSAVDDILEEYGVEKTRAVDIFPDLTPEEEVVLSALQDKPCSVDDLIDLLDYSAPVILRIITELEIKKAVYKDDEELYSPLYRQVKDRASLER